MRAECAAQYCVSLPSAEAARDQQYEAEATPKGAYGVDVDRSSLFDLAAEEMPSARRDR